jgi:hypothetical protein
MMQSPQEGLFQLFPDQAISRLASPKLYQGPLQHLHRHTFLMITRSGRQSLGALKNLSFVAVEHFFYGSTVYPTPK